MKFWIFQMTLLEDKLYIKIIEINEILNFVVRNSSFKVV